MPFTTAQKFKEILMALSVLRYILKSSGVTGTTDAYKNAEKFFETVLNLTYSLELQNMNVLTHNYPAIDLGDKAARICFQITGENSSKKIQETITKFFSHHLDKQYDELKFLILTAKKSYSKKISVPTHFDFNIQRDVLDVDDVLKTIESQKAEVINSIHQFVEGELSTVLQPFAPRKGLLASAERRVDSPAKNAKRLIEFLQLESAEYKDLREALKEGYLKLTSLSDEVREYLYIILTRGRIIDHHNQRIGITPVVLEGILKVDHYRQQQMYLAVYELGLAEVPEGEHPPMLYLYWGSRFDYDVFGAFRKMFKDSPDKLRRLIVDGDFTLLDK